MRSAIEKTLDELRMILPANNFMVQPQTAFKKIVEYESKYQLNTMHIFEYKVREVSESTINDWIRNVETFVEFSGDMSRINTIK